MTDPEAPVVRAVSAAIEQVLGRPARQVVSPGRYDQKHIVRVGLLEACIAYGPGIPDLAHQPDEYVGIDDMTASARVMAAATLALWRGSGDRQTPANAHPAPGPHPAPGHEENRDR